MTSIFDQGLDKNAANFVALSPVSFVERTAEVFGDLTAVIYGQPGHTRAQNPARTAPPAAGLPAHRGRGGTTGRAPLHHTPGIVGGA